MALFFFLGQLSVIYLSCINLLCYIKSIFVDSLTNKNYPTTESTEKNVTRIVIARDECSRAKFSTFFCTIICDENDPGRSFAIHCINFNLEPLSKCVFRHIFLYISIRFKLYFGASLLKEKFQSHWESFFPLKCANRRKIVSSFHWKLDSSGV